MPELVELGGIDVDMHDLRAGTKLGDLARRSIVEPGAECDQEIRLLEDEVREACAVHTEHAEREPVVVRDGAEAHQRHHARQRRTLRELERQRRGTRLHDAAAEIQNRPRRGLDQLGRPRDSGRVDRRRGVGFAGRRPLADLDELGLHVLRYVDEHRPRPSGDSDLERARNYVQQVLGRSDEKVVLRDRQREPERVDLLKRISSDHPARHLSRDSDEGNRVELRVRNRGQQIRRAGTR